VGERDRSASSFESESAWSRRKGENETYLGSLGGERLAVDPPLRLHDGLDNISRLTVREKEEEKSVRGRIEPEREKKERDERADGDLHRVVLGLDVKTLLLESLENSSPGVESFHSLEETRRPRVSERIRGNETKEKRTRLKTDLEPLSGVVVEGSVVVEKVDELEVVPLSTLVIVVVVSRSDLDGSGSEGHVDGDGVGDDGDSSSRDEGVDGELSVEVL